MKTLSSRQWVGVVWAIYLLLPLCLLLLTVTFAELLLAGKNPEYAIKAYPFVVALPVMAQLSVPIVAMFGAGWAVIRPLQAMSAAARKVGKHDLDFALPRSRVREVNEALQAFTAMGDELRMALARQVELEQERQFYVSAIAHDLNSPIFALRGYLAGLESGIVQTPEQVHHYLEVCQAKVRELEHFAADLMAYTQIERLEQTLQPTPQDLGSLMLAAADSVRPQLATKHIMLTLPQHTQACPCLVDPLLLQRAIVNVLENAVRYTPEAGAISVDWSATGSDLRFSIADTGPGIALQDLPNIFAPFYRGDVSRNLTTGGVGLGLAVAQRILQAHGGSLTATNHPVLGGALVIGTLPATVALVQLPQ